MKLPDCPTCGAPAIKLVQYKQRADANRTRRQRLREIAAACRADGSTVAAIAAALGVHRVTVQRWLA